MTQRPNAFTSKQISIPYEQPASKALGPQISTDYEHGALTADDTVKLFKAEREFLLEAASIHNETGLALAVRSI